MIARIWHGWTFSEDADLYESLLRTKVLPEIHRVEGYLGAYLLRHEGEGEGEVEFVTVTLFDSMEAVRAFAGEDSAHSVVPPEARALLSRFDDESVHYDVVQVPEL